MKKILYRLLRFISAVVFFPITIFRFLSAIFVFALALFGGSSQGASGLRDFY